ncbi:MAG TPA: NAD(+) synthase [Pseudomonadota bacterium]|nr:NAD(+) synthase [Pseudomonadota bacterium]
MRLLRLGLGNVNTTVGATSSNVDRAVAACHRLFQAHTTLAALPEQVIGGYPPEDLLLWPGFVKAQTEGLAKLASATAKLDMAIICGVVVQAMEQVYNCAAFVLKGEVWGVVPKEKLPLYNVFYEARTLARGFPGLYTEVDLGPCGKVPFGDLLFDCDFGRVALEVCEDIWSPDGPMRRRSYQGAELVVNLSASPFRIGVHATRKEMLNTRASDNNVTVLYVNAVGANDGLIFDGGGFVSQNGRLLLDAPRFVEGEPVCTVDLRRTTRLRTENTTWRTDRAEYLSRLPSSPVDHEAGGGSSVGQAHVIPVGRITETPKMISYPGPVHRNFFLPAPSVPVDPKQTFCEELLDAMAMGVGDYFEKTGAFKQIGVALSGGRDSLLCLLVAHRYVKRRFQTHGPSVVKERTAEILRAFYMPTRYSSSNTRNAAEIAARELGVPFVILPIEEAFSQEVAATQKMLQPGEELTPLTVQNIQARLRAERMWNWSNAVSGLFLQTGNMSEKAAGYTTIGGDLMGCLAVIANLPKTVVNCLLDYLLETEKLDGIRETIAIPASAELAPDQQDERDLMPFPVLDACIALHAAEKLDAAELGVVLTEMFPEFPKERLFAWATKFTTLFSRAIYKWVQAPLSLHLGNLDLERERSLQLPVVTRGEWQKRPPST